MNEDKDCKRAVRVGKKTLGFKLKKSQKKVNIKRPKMVKTSEFGPAVTEDAIAESLWGRIKTTMRRARVGKRFDKLSDNEFRKAKKLDYSQKDQNIKAGRHTVKSIDYMLHNIPREHKNYMKGDPDVRAQRGVDQSFGRTNGYSPSERAVDRKTGKYKIGARTIVDRANKNKAAAEEYRKLQYAPTRPLGKLTPRNPDFTKIGTPRKKRLVSRGFDTSSGKEDISPKLGGNRSRRLKNHVPQVALDQERQDYDHIQSLIGAKKNRKKKLKESVLGKLGNLYRMFQTERKRSKKFKYGDARAGEIYTDYHGVKKKDRVADAKKHNRAPARREFE